MRGFCLKVLLRELDDERVSRHPEDAFVEPNGAVFSRVVCPQRRGEPRRSGWLYSRSVRVGREGRRQRAPQVFLVIPLYGKPSEAGHGLAERCLAKTLRLSSSDASPLGERGLRCPGAGYLWGLGSLSI